MQAEQAEFLAYVWYVNAAGAYEYECEVAEEQGRAVSPTVRVTFLAAAVAFTEAYKALAEARYDLNPTEGAYMMDVVTAFTAARLDNVC